MPSTPITVSFPVNKGSIARYADGRYISVWNTINATGDSFVYGKVFSADGTVLKEQFEIARATGPGDISDATAVVLTTGEVAVAWATPDNVIAGKVLSTSYGVPADAFAFGRGSQGPESNPELHALADGRFSVTYEEDMGNEEEPWLMVNYIARDDEGDWGTFGSGGIYRDPSVGARDATIMKNGYVAAVVGFASAGNTVVQALVISPTGEEKFIPIDTTPGAIAGIRPGICAVGDNKFAVVWEDKEGAAQVLRVKVLDAEGSAASGQITFTKPAGTMDEKPVVTQLADGGFAVAFTLKVGDDQNVYTASAKANGEILTNTTHVGTTTAGAQYNPSIVALKGGSYAVSWMDNSGSGPSFMVEIIGGTTSTGNSGGHSAPTVWTGSNGNDVYKGTSASETLKGLGGKDILEGNGGNDKLYGGAGKDTLSGGEGQDIFVFDAKPGKNNADKIVDFTVKSDTIWLDNAVFTKLGKKGSEAGPVDLNKKFFKVGEATKKEHVILYDKKTGALSYDKDGNGDQDAVVFAYLERGLKLKASDFDII